jgi:hypothetical protein
LAFANPPLDKDVIVTTCPRKFESDEVVMPECQALLIRRTCYQKRIYGNVVKIECLGDGFIRAFAPLLERLFRGYHATDEGGGPFVQEECSGTMILFFRCLPLQSVCARWFYFNGNITIDKISQEKIEFFNRLLKPNQRKDMLQNKNLNFQSIHK